MIYFFFKSILFLDFPDSTEASATVLIWDGGQYSRRTVRQPWHTSCYCCPWPAGGARRRTADKAHSGERTKPQLPHRCLPWHELPPQWDPKEPAAGDFGVPFRYYFIILCTFRNVGMADVQGLNRFFLVTLLSAVSWSQCGFQTAESVEWEGERVPGAAEELRLQEAGTDRCAKDCSSCHWRQDLYLLEIWVFFMVALEIKAPFNAIFICIIYKRVRVWSIRSFMHHKRKKINFRLKGISEKYCSLAFVK